MRVKKSIDKIIGKKFNKLTIAKYLYSAGRNHYFECYCDCGNPNPVKVSWKDLIGNRVKSCGCLRGKWTKNIAGKKFGRLTAIRDTRKRQGGYAVWECRCDCGNKCEVRYVDLVLQHTRSCGCLIEEFKKNNFIQGTSVCMINPTVKIRSDNTSGVRGVGFSKANDAWRARITFQGTTYYLGYYKNKVDAISIRKTAESMMYGPFLEWYKENYKNFNPVKISHRHGPSPYSKKTLLSALQHKAKKLNRAPIAEEMIPPSPSYRTYVRVFGSWNAALKEAGLKRSKLTGSNKKCSFPGCNDNVFAKGYCKKHYYKNYYKSH